MKYRRRQIAQLLIPEFEYHQENSKAL